MRRVLPAMLLAGGLLCALPDQAAADLSSAAWQALLLEQSLEADLVSQLVPKSVVADLPQWQSDSQWRNLSPAAGATDFPGVTVLHLFATWCKPCEREMPKLLQTWESLRRSTRSGDKLQMILLLQDNNPKALATWPFQPPPPGRQLVVRGDFEERLRKHLEPLCDAQSFVIPTTLIVDQCGIVRHAFVGSLQGRFPAFSNAVKRLLAIRPQLRCAAVPGGGTSP
jgi:hypothetical protein